MKKGTFIAVFSIVAAVLIFLLAFAVAYTTQNRAISLEEQIHESNSAIEIQEKRRVDLIVNLVDTVKNYDKHEKGTLTELAEARSNAQKGNVKDAKLAIQAVTEAYPKLESQGNYKELMNELSTTENKIAEIRDNYNQQVKNYNKFVRKFPNGMLLDMMGYEKIDAKYLEYNASSDAPTDLFKDK